MKKILVLNYFISGKIPTSGGQLRYFNLYHKLSKYYDITLLSQGPKDKKKKISFSPTFREIRVPKDRVHKKIKQELKKGKLITPFISLVRALSADYPTKYSRYYEELYPHHDVIIHDFPYMLGFDRYLGVDNKPRIYNSHNHEFLLVKQLWKGENAGKYIVYLYGLEKRLAEYADLVFATSEEERDSFTQIYNLDSQKVKLAPNGVNPEEWTGKRKKSNPRTTAFFIGSKYPPNIEAVAFILHDLSPQCPEIDFIIAGTCCPPFMDIKKPNVKLLGKVDQHKKMELFYTADMAINPMFSGGGINIKTLEFLSSGLPLFSTEFGVRGLNLIDEKHYIKANKENFANLLNKYHDHRKRLRSVAVKGQKYINDNFSWKNIAKNMKQEIDKLLKKNDGDD